MELDKTPLGGEIDAVDWEIKTEEVDISDYEAETEHEAEASVVDVPLSVLPQEQLIREDWGERHKFGFSLPSPSDTPDCTPFVIIIPNLLETIMMGDSNCSKNSCARRIELTESENRATSVAGAEAEKQSVAESPPSTAESFACGLCLAKFSTKTGLTEHVTRFCFEDLFPSSAAVESLEANGELVTMPGETFNCSCRLQFKDILELNLHLLHHPKIGCFLVKCKFCNKVFSNIVGMDEHIRLTHDGEKMCECTFCLEPFSLSASRNQHMLTHTGKERYECKFCPKRFSVGYSRDNHLLTHTGGKNYDCEFCWKLFAKSSYRDKHLLTHTGDEEYACRYCSKRFGTSEIRNEHLPTHTGESARFAHGFARDKHASTRTAERKYECKFCTKRFTTSAIRNEHSQLHTGEKKYTCQFCPERFRDRRSKIQHLRRHYRDKGVDPVAGAKRVTSIWYENESNAADSRPLTGESFECGLCRAKFPTKASLTDHVTGSCFKNLSVPSTGVAANSAHVTPSGETFECCCKMQFKDNAELNQHKLRNPNEQCVLALTCKFCNKIFDDVSIKAQHVLTHTGKMEYQCKFCPKRFSQCNKRNAHLLIHTNKEKFGCQFCPKRFGTDRSRRQHLERCHKDVNSVAGAKNESNAADSQPLTGESFECGLCRAKFPAKASLTDHVTDSCFKNLLTSSTPVEGVAANTAHLTLSDETFECCCKMQFKDNAELNQHKLRNPNEQCVLLLRCKYCYKIFEDADSKAQHQLTHTGKMEYQCKFCPKRFIHCNKRNAHLLVHTNKKKFECQFCPKRFSTDRSRRRHLERCHKDVNSVVRAENQSNAAGSQPLTGEPFECGLCRAKFPAKASLTDHVTGSCFKNLLTSSTPVESRVGNSARVTFSGGTFECYCKMQFKDILELNQHMIRNPNEQCVLVLMCKYCNKIFEDADSKALHQLTHTGEMEYQCKFCPKRFSQCNKRNSHLHAHGEKKIACELCPRVFMRRSQVNCHLQHVHRAKNVHSVPRAKAKKQSVAASSQSTTKPLRPLTKVFGRSCYLTQLLLHEHEDKSVNSVRGAKAKNQSAVNSSDSTAEPSKIGSSSIGAKLERISTLRQKRKDKNMNSVRGAKAKKRSATVSSHSTAEPSKIGSISIGAKLQLISTLLQKRKEKNVNSVRGAKAKKRSAAVSSHSTAEPSKIGSISIGAKLQLISTLLQKRKEKNVKSVRGAKAKKRSAAESSPLPAASLKIWSDRIRAKLQLDSNSLQGHEDKNVNSAPGSDVGKQNVTVSSHSTAETFECDSCRAKFPTKKSITEHVTGDCFKNLFPSSINW